MKTTSASILLPGLFASALLATVATLGGTAFPLIGGAVFGIVLGMLVRPFLHRPSLDAGVRFTSKKVLQWAIILLGFKMQMALVLAVGARSLLVMAFTLSASFLTAALMARLLRVPAREAVLIGVGTSICGGSAIAATSPVIGARDEEVAQSISTIFLFNILAVFLFPALGHMLGLSDEGFGVWAGTAVNDTSSVVATASAWSQAAGNTTALSLATIVKLTRTLMIVPITLVLALYEARRVRRTALADSASGSGYSFVRIFPWFVIGFLLAAVANSTLRIPTGWSTGAVQAGSFMIVMAMSAIGLSTDLGRLLKNGKRPILLGLACWVAVALVSLLAQGLSGLM